MSEKVVGTTATTATTAACGVGESASCGTAHWQSKTEAEWRKILTPEQFEIARRAGTERAFSGKYWNTKAPGTYVCACCGQPLFASKTKFDSGTGWPSYWQPVTPEAVATRSDHDHGMTRVEALCSRCDAHLGHVFPDGPRPTGLRYCINSASLEFEPEGGKVETAK